MLGLTAYDDYKLSEWVQEHPADLFHLMQSDIQWTFYMTRSLEYCLFLFALWRSKRVANKKLVEDVGRIEENQAGDPKQNQTAINMNQNINKLRIDFFNQLWMVGSMFFASTPLSTMFANNFVRESNQQMVQTFLITGAQVACYLFLIYMLTSKNSKFHSATFRNQSILPDKMN